MNYAENKRKLLSMWVLFSLNFELISYKSGRYAHFRNTLPEWFWSGISVDKLCNYLNYYLIINVLKWISDHWPRNYFSYLVCFASSSRQAFKYSTLSHNRHLNMQYFAVQIISDTRSWLEWVGRHELLGIHCCIY